MNQVQASSSSLVASSGFVFAWAAVAGSSTLVAFMLGWREHTSGVGLPMFIERKTKMREERSRRSDGQILPSSGGDMSMSPIWVEEAASAKRLKFERS